MNLLSATRATVREPDQHYLDEHRTGVVRSVLMRQETTLLMVIVAIGAVATWKSDLFLTSDNLTEVLRSSVIYFVVGCGAALLIIGGGLDFSAGAVFTLGGLATSQMLVSSFAWPLAVVLGLACCGAFGIVNHLIITHWHVPPIIATLGTYFVLSGVDALITGGDDVLPLPNDCQQLGQGSVGGVPNVILIERTVPPELRTTRGAARSSSGPSCKPGVASHCIPADIRRRRLRRSRLRRSRLWFPGVSPTPDRNEMAGSDPCVRTIACLASSR